jgi:hypothetical protein
MTTCINCSYKSDGKFCPNCGQPLEYERIKLSSLLHDVVHTFTHFEHKLLFTIKELAVRPGFMQKNFLHGYRAKSQKPFSMFVVCGTVCSLVLYFIYMHTSNAEEYFYKHYWVFLHAALLPFYAFSTWLFFKSSRLYYAEALVLTIYMLGFMLLLVIPINLLRYSFNNGVVLLGEVIVLIAYTIWTNLNFFDNKPSWLITVKSFICIVLNFAVFNVIATWIVSHTAH